MSSVFAKLRTETLIGDPLLNGCAVDIRGLSPRALETAAKEHQRQALQLVKEAKSNGTEEAFAAVDPAAVAAYQEQMRENPLLSYDAETLINAGVTGWTFELPFEPASVSELDEAVRDLIAERILRLSKPSLFRSVAEQEADRKNG